MGNPYKAQVIDDNLKIRVDGTVNFTDASNQPSSDALPLTGGTLTGELTVDTAAGVGQAVELQGSRTSQHDVFRIDYPHSIVVFDSDGAFSFSSNDTLIATFAGTGGTGAEVIINSNSIAQTMLDVNELSNGGRVRIHGSGRVEISAVAGDDQLDAGVFSIYPDGTPVLRNHAAQADGNLSAGDLSLWFDQTNGSAKLMVKAKQADGTVKTAAIALT